MSGQCAGCCSRCLERVSFIAHGRCTWDAKGTWAELEHSHALTAGTVEIPQDSAQTLSLPDERTNVPLVRVLRGAAVNVLTDCTSQLSRPGRRFQPSGNQKHLVSIMSWQSTPSLASAMPLLMTFL